MLRAPRQSFVYLAPLVLVFYSFLFLPPETEFLVYKVRFFSYRVGVLLMTVPALWMMMRSTRRAINPMDLAIAIMGFWMMLSFIVVYGWESGIVRGAGITIDAGFSYFVARACIRTPTDLRRFLILCLPGLFFAGMLLGAESLSGQLIFRPLAAEIFGHMTAFQGGEETGSLILIEESRLGLLRAYGPFDHPILAGAVMVGFLPLFYFSGLRGWPRPTGLLLALTGFFSLSSAAFLAMIIAVGAIIIHHVKPYFAKVSWWTIVGMLGVLAMVVQVGSKSGIISVIGRMTLSPDTANYRTLIWQYGSQSVAKHPMFGIGYREWERLYWMSGDSVDAHFLLLAMRHGIIVPIVLLSAIFYGMYKIGTNMSSLNSDDRTLMLGLNITIFLYFLVGQTVNFFSASNVAFMSMIALLASMVAWSDEQVKAQRRFALQRVRNMLYEAHTAQQTQVAAPTSS
jgi:O-antigen ligase